LLDAKEHKGGHKLYVESSKLPVDHPRQEEIRQEMQRIYAEALEAADPEWKALLGNAGSEGNLASNASLDITRPFTATSGVRSRFQEPFENTQASPLMTKGSPSSTPYVRGVDNISLH
jgi:hypothetical protein